MENFKKGQKVARLMTRHNPQLGTYYVFQEVEITKVNKKSYSCDDENTYDTLTGYRANKVNSAYGSAYYEIMSIDAAKVSYANLIARGCRARGMENILCPESNLVINK